MCQKKFSNPPPAAVGSRGGFEAGGPRYNDGSAVQGYEDAGPDNRANRMGQWYHIHVNSCRQCLPGAQSFQDTRTLLSLQQPKSYSGQYPP